MPLDTTVVTAATIPVAEAVQSRCEVAAQILERALATGPKDANVAYLLALAHKRQGKTMDARNALRKIPTPDANVLLQMGLLSLQEGNLAQAEEEFSRAAELDPGGYEICYNLLLTRLTLGRVEDSYNLIPRALELVPGASPAQSFSGGSPADEQRFLQVLQALLHSCIRDGAPMPDITPKDEERLLKVVLSLGQLDTVLTLLRALADARPNSLPVREAQFEAVLVKGKELIDRCSWTEAELLLRPLRPGCQRQPQRPGWPCSTCSAAAPA